MGSPLGARCRQNSVDVHLDLMLCYHPYLVFMLFADLLSLHLVTFLMFLILVLLWTRSRPW